MIYHEGHEEEGEEEEEERNRKWIQIYLEQPLAATRNVNHGVHRDTEKNEIPGPYSQWKASLGWRITTRLISTCLRDQFSFNLATEIMNAHKKTR